MTGIIDLLGLPIVFTVISLFSFIIPPKRINALYGYRSGKAMSNERLWKAANKYAPRLMLKLSAIYLTSSLLLTFITMIYPSFRSYASGIIFISALIFFIPVIVKTEKHLKNLEQNTTT